MISTAAILAVLLGGGLATSRARAEPHWTPEAQRRIRAQAYAQAIEQRLSAIAGVQNALAQVQLPDPLDTALDAPPTEPTAQVTVTLASASPGQAPPSAEQLAQWAASVAPELDAANVQLQARQAPIPAAPVLVHVGPFETSPHTAPWLRASLIALLCTIAGLAALVMRYARRRLPP